MEINFNRFSTNVPLLSDIKNISHVHTFSFALKTNLGSTKTEVDKLDINRLVSVKNEVVKKTVYDKLVAKVNNVDTGEFSLKTKYNLDKTELEKKLPNTSRFVKKSE